MPRPGEHKINGLVRIARISYSYSDLLKHTLELNSRSSGKTSKGCDESQGTTHVLMCPWK